MQPSSLTSLGNRSSMTEITDRPSWVQDAVFYQIFPDRFARSGRVASPGRLEAWDAPPTYHGYKGGDLYGVVERLDWLTDLGVNAIYFNPVFQSASNHRYHTHDYFRIDPLLGGDEAFRSLIDACHQRDIRVIIDGVFNHASRGFFQFNDLLENGPDSPYVDWFVVEEWPLNAYAAHEPPNYSAWWGLHALPKLNTDNPVVREFLMEVAEHWTSTGIDGWRLDVPAEISTPGFWEEFRSRIRTINPDVYIVGEIWDDARHWISSGELFDGTMNYIFTGLTISFAAGRHVDPKVVEGLTYQVYPPIDAASYAEHLSGLLRMYPGDANLANLNLLNSHDTPRLLTVARGDMASVQLSALLMLTFPGAPCIYYGDEIGLPGRHDPDSRRAFPWDHRDSWDTELLQTYRSLIALRKAHPALRSDRYDILWPPGAEPGGFLYLVRRAAHGENLIVAVNAGDAAEATSLSVVDLGGTVAELLWGSGEMAFGEHAARISMPPRSGAVWRLD